MPVYKKKAAGDKFYGQEMRHWSSQKRRYKALGALHPEKITRKEK